MISFVSYNSSKYYTEVKRLAFRIFPKQYHLEICDVLENGSPDTVLAIEKEKVIGFALLNKRPPLELRKYSSGSFQNYIEIAFLGISPTKQGKGIGSGLLQYVKDLDYAGIWLQVTNENIGAQKLYARHGFEQWATYETPFDSGRLLVWSKARHEWLLRLRPRESL
jgi:ribosomal protein S18 acetylase RimI-like enzyme